MEELKKRILEDARIYDGSVLKVDSFLNHLIRMDALDAGCNRRRSSVSGLLHIAIKIQIVIVCAAYRRYSDGGTFYVQFVYNLGYQSMNDSVGTAGAVVHGYIHQCMGSVKYYSHG
jgi:hypothetical protein